MSGHRHHPTWTQIFRGLACAVVIVSLAGCVSTQNPAFRPSDSASDTSSFALILETILADTSTDFSSRPLHVDPRPLERNRSIMAVTPTSLAPVSAEELEARNRTIVRLGMVADDAELPVGCVSSTSPSSAAQDGHLRCPSTNRSVIAVGYPLALPDSNSWTSRILVSNIGPVGYNVVVLDFVIERVAGRWRYVRRGSGRLID
jgi:hypothetical protein